MRSASTDSKTSHNYATHKHPQSSLKRPCENLTSVEMNLFGIFCLEEVNLFFTLMEACLFSRPTSCANFVTRSGCIPVECTRSSACDFRNNAVRRLAFEAQTLARLRQIVDQKDGASLRPSQSKIHLQMPALWFSFPPAPPVFARYMLMVPSGAGYLFRNSKSLLQQRMMAHCHHKLQPSKRTYGSHTRFSLCCTYLLWWWLPQ